MSVAQGGYMEMFLREVEWDMKDEVLAWDTEDEAIRQMEIIINSIHLVTKQYIFSVISSVTLADGVLAQSQTRLSDYCGSGWYCSVLWWTVASVTA